jgi:hypothetical protein
MNEKNKLVRVEVPRLQNETCFQFLKENRACYQKYNPTMLNIGGFMLEYDQAMAEFDEALEVIRKSAETARISAADTAFDQAFSALHGYVKVCLNHYDADVIVAAQNIEPILHHYRDLGKQSYRQELGSAQNMLDTLGEHLDDVGILNLIPWMDALSEKMQILSSLLDTRTEEEAQRPTIRTIDARRKAEKLYLQITDRIDAMINVNGKNYVVGFFNEYNAHATEYKNNLAQHLGRIHKHTD